MPARLLWVNKTVASHKKPKNMTRHAKGLRAELVALMWLWLKGYVVCARRYKTPFGEIDLVMRRGKTLVFVEVKARPDLDGGLSAIMPVSQGRIRQAAELFLQRNPRYQNYLCRFDAVVVRPRAMPYHLQDAWRD